MASRAAPVVYADLDELGPPVLRADGWVEFRCGLRLHAPGGDQEPQTSEELWNRIVDVATARWISQGQAAAMLALSRERLDALVALAPAELVGRPTDISDPRSNRRHYRWDRDLVHAWFRALGSWQRAPAEPVEPVPQVRRPARRTRSGSQRRSITARLEERDAG